MMVRMWMTKEPAVAAPTMPLLEAHELLRSRKIRRLPVVEKGRLAGIVTMTDMQKLLFVGENGATLALPHHYEVKDVMTKSPLTVAPNDPIEHAALLMHQNRISSLPVLENARVVGIITGTDVFRSFIGIMGLEEQGRRISLEAEHDNSGLQSLLDLADLHDVQVLSVVTLRSYSQTHSLVILRARGAGVEEFIDDVRGGGYRIVDIA